jgi:hypothetical protein
VKISKLETKKIELDDRIRAVENENASKLKNFDALTGELEKVELLAEERDCSQKRRRQNGDVLHFRKSAQECQKQTSAIGSQQGSALPATEPRLDRREKATNFEHIFSHSGRENRSALAKWLIR